MAGTRVRLVGRAGELADIAAFLAAPERLPGALLLEGEAGIGKTALWEQALAEARHRSYTTLAARGAGSEVDLSFAALTDLLSPVVAPVMPRLPELQRRALAAALLIEEASGAAPDYRTVAAAVVAVLRLLAREAPMLIAVDDVQWLDRSSAAILEFAARRLGDEPVAFLLARRVARDEPAPLGLDRLVPVEAIRRIRVAPLGLGQLHALIQRRLGATFSRPVLSRIHEVSAGNPLFALELARALERAGLRPPGDEPLPLPGSLRELVGERLATLPERTREALLLAALSPEATVSLVSTALGEDAWGHFRPAAGAAVIDLDGERIRFGHPLFSSAVQAEADLGLRRDAHRRLASATEDDERRTRHLALAADEPDAELAAALEAAAHRAAGRGARPAEAALLEHALRLTPAADAADRRRRQVAAARAFLASGDGGQAEELLTQALATAEPGPERARLLASLAAVEAGTAGARQAVARYKRALQEAGDDAILSVAIHGELALVLRFTEGVAEAKRHARRAVELAEELGDPALLRDALTSLSQLEFNAGHARAREPLDRALGLEPDGEPGPRIVLAHQLLWSGQLDEARTVLEPVAEALRSRADIGESEALWYLSLVRFRLGDWKEAERLAERSEMLGLQAGFKGEEAGQLVPRTLLAAHRGDVETARRLARRGLVLAESVGSHPFAAVHRGALGFLALSLGDARSAAAELIPGVESFDALEIREPGLSVLFFPDAVEALVLLDRLEEAAGLLQPWSERARVLDRAAALAPAERCRALIGAARGDLDEAVGAIESALATHRRVPEPFALARTLLVAGALRRRARRRAAAREALGEAAALFERLGAALWAERARAELGRISGRAPASGELTPTEGRVAALVAEGRSTKEVAAELVCSARTVDGHLARIYRKLGVRSRTELAHRLASGAPKVG